jgi:DeoR family ulaG and ulaABCDEF operon transcriptional repressor
MSESERQRLITDALRHRPFATVRDILDIVHASPATIRRDISKLHEAGLIRKVFGGIALPSDADAAHTRPFEENRVLNVQAKKAIAAEAEKLCRDGDRIIVYGGTTCFLFAQRIARRNLKVFTHSMPVAAALWEHGTCHVTMGGGELHREPGVVFSPDLRQPDFYASKLFLGAQGLAPNGARESHPLMVRLVETLVERADEIILLADATKFDVHARHLSLPFERIGTLITDERAREEHLRAASSKGTKLVIASVAPIDSDSTGRA